VTLRRISLARLEGSAEEIGRLRALLAAGGVAALPTETFYGLGADPKSEDGVRRVVEAKGRDDRKPLPVVFATPEQLAALGVAAPKALLDRYLALWPAPLTVVLPLKTPIAASRGLATLAVRIPAAADLRTLLEAVGAVTATSANRSDAPALADPDDVARVFEGRVDLLVDGGRTPGRLPSTLIDATVDPPVLLRRGAYPWPG
jgi:L-threonylcarbamoyladenylate synthase